MPHLAPLWLALALLACHRRDPEVTPRPEGSLRIVQIDLTGGLSIGEATLIVGPDGSSALIDVGNDAHADEVLDALDREIGSRSVDAVVLTHFHADHIGALDALLEKGLETGAIVSRGLVHVGKGTSSGEIDDLEGTAAWASRTDLCDEAGCDLPFTLPLGASTLTIAAADGRCFDGTTVVDSDLDLPDDDDGENARSLAGVLTFGDFRYAFAGDLTGGGKGTPDVESFVARTLPEDLVPAGGVSLLHLDHHGIDSSSNDAWLDRMLPAGRHDAVVGTNHVYLDSPGNEVMERIGDRLGGGSVWLGQAGSLADEDDPHLRITGGAVTVTAEADGTYVIE